MKFKTTKRDVNNGFWKRVSIGYCDAQYLLYYKNPAAYTCGTHGWNADIYDFENIAIVTGYRPFGNVDCNYSILRKYEQKAEKIVHNYNMEYDERKKVVTDLLKEYLKTVCDTKVVTV